MKPEKEAGLDPHGSDRKNGRAYVTPRVTFAEPLEVVAAFCNPNGSPSGKQAGEPGCAISFS